MTRNIQARTAMTAIAAVMAATPISAFAQEVTTTEPVVEAAPEAVTTSEPLSAEPASASETAVASETSEATPVVAEKSDRKAVTRSARSAAPRSTKPSSNAATTPADFAPAPTADAPIAAPLPAAAAATPVAEPLAQPTAEASTAVSNDGLEDALPIAGAAGLGILALAGAGMAMRRRKRHAADEDGFGEEEWATNEPVAYDEPAAASEPAFARTSQPAPARVIDGAPVTALPAGFDLSRFGRHVQAAYRGPTPDNPSLSLKNRLRRASFFDQQERRAAQTSDDAFKASKKPTRENRQPHKPEFMFRPAAQTAYKLKPAY